MVHPQVYGLRDGGKREVGSCFIFYMLTAPLYQGPMRLEERETPSLESRTLLAREMI